MSRYKAVIPAVIGAVAGGLVALIVAGGSNGNGHTTTTIVQTTGGGAQPTAFAKNKGLSINQIYRQDSPGVVDITVISNSSNPSVFGGGGQQQEEGEGAGVVYDKSGDILTDEHVVTGAVPGGVTVNFQDGQTAKAKVLGSDATTDVGVIKVDVPASELHPIPMADSSTAQVGDPVVAIGSPFSLPETVTQGIVSAVGRSIKAPNQYTISGAIQTDAAINPGNSGGPLLNAEGKVLGLNDQIDTNQGPGQEGQSAGIGFATPANEDVKIASKIIGGHPIEHAYIGVCLDSSPSGQAQIATQPGFDCTQPVVAGGPASQAGIKPGDTILAVDGKSVTNSDNFISTLQTYKPGQTVTLTVKRSGSTHQIQIKLGNQKQAQQP